MGRKGAPERAEEARSCRSAIVTDFSCSPFTPRLVGRRSILLLLFLLTDAGAGGTPVWG